MCKCISTTVRVSNTVQITFFLVMRSKITIVTSCDLLIVVILSLIFSSLKLEIGRQKHFRNVTEIKYGLDKLVVLFITFYQKALKLNYYKKFIRNLEPRPQEIEKLLGLQKTFFL